MRINSRHWYILASIAIILLAIFLRTVRMDRRTVFSGDEGMDLIIVWNMEHTGHRPLIGPYLSVENIFVPPTYYYIMWFFYHMNPTPEGVIRGFLVLNIATLILLMIFTRKIAGDLASLILGFLFAVSWPFIVHGRQYWQPFPVQFFLAVWLFTLWHAYNRRSLILMTISSISFAYALSVYPTTILLLPLAGYHLVRWVRTSSGTKGVLTFVYSGILGVFTALPAYLPQIIFSVLHNFTTFRMLKTLPQYSVFLENVWLATKYHALFLFDNVFNVMTVFEGNQAVFMLMFYAAALILLSVILRPTEERSGEAVALRQFFPWGYLAAGLPFIFFTPDSQNYRVWGFLPIELIIIAVIIAKGFLFGQATRRLAVAILLAYTLTNGLTTWHYLVKDAANDIRITYRAAQKIKSDIAAHTVPTASIGVRYKDRDPHSYNAYRVLYWLVADRVITVPVLETGNVTMDLHTRPEQKYIYLVCDSASFGDPSECAKQFESKYSAYKLDRSIKSKRLPIYIFKQKSLSEQAI